MGSELFYLFEAEKVKLEESWFEQEKFSKVKNKRKIFIHFTKLFVSRYELSSMESFSISFRKPEEHHEDISKLVNFALDRNVRSLNLDFSDPSWKKGNVDYHAISPQFELPMLAYSHAANNLHTLMLSFCKFRVPEFERFTKLKFLGLSFLNLDLSSIKTVLSSLQSLEVVALNRCRLESLHRVSLPRVHSLFVKKCRFDDPRFSIVAPKLRFLYYIGNLVLFSLKVDENVMAKAALDFDVESDVNAANGIRVVDILRELSSCVKVLNVSTFVLRVLPCAKKPIIRLPKVQHLTIHTSLDTSELSGIGCILKSCPSMEALIIMIEPEGILPDYEPPPIPIQGLDACECVKASLKSIVLYGFTGSEHQVSLLKQILKHGLMMKKLILLVSEEGKSSEYATTEFWDSVKKASQYVKVKIKMFG